MVSKFVIDNERVNKKTCSVYKGKGMKNGVFFANKKYVITLFMFYLLPKRIL